ncbi:cold-shock protein [Streptomyces sp. NPDC048257]|uniref:cold-shock protein n=1 Tax=Streptomyces sp. NPDC048257 TaxID=3365526 RepID=UPI003720544B
MSPCGVVKWFDPDRGIGLISQESAGGPDVQAEASAIQAKDHRLHQGEEVLFDITLDSAGLRADNIHRSRYEAAPGQETPRARSDTAPCAGPSSSPPPAARCRGGPCAVA